MTDTVRTPRTLFIADHIWDAFARMSQEMGSERDGLINQALFTFARLNGYLTPGVSAGVQPIAAAPAPAPGVAASAAHKRMSAPLDNRAVTITPASAVQSPGQVPPDPMATAMARPSAIAEMDRQASNGQRASPKAGSVEIDDSLLGDDMGAQATSMELPNLSELGISPRKAGTPPPVSDRSVNREKTLVLMAEGRELDRVVKDRFLIGRGKHCDLIINSGKVSREHAAIIREGTDYYIEDLGSSNGTWYDKRRITRRQIEDGDEYYICAEKLSCVFR